MFGSYSNTTQDSPPTGTPGLSSNPNADKKEDKFEGPVIKEVEYTFKPSGQEVVTDKVVYKEGKDEPFTETLKKVFIFPLKILKWIFHLILRTITFFQKACLTLLFLIVVSSLAIVVTFLYKPPFIWEPLKIFLNDDLKVISVDDIDLDLFYEEMNNKALEEGKVSINNSELTALIREFTLLQDTFTVESKPSGMTFFVNLDESQKPLWFFIETGKENTKMEIKRAGFGKFDMPISITKNLNGTIVLAFKVIEEQISAENHIAFFNLIINESKLDNSLSIQNIVMREDEVDIYFYRQ